MDARRDHRILIVGLGNPILGDDGVGWKIAEQCEREIAAPQIDYDYCCAGGIFLMERLVGYDRVVLIDAAKTNQQPPGNVSCFALDELPDPGAGHTASPHDASLQTALQVGRTAGAHVPDAVMVVTVEAEIVDLFSERLSPAVEQAVPHGVEAVKRQVAAWSGVC